MEEEKKAALASLRKKLDIANKFRLAFLFIALVILLMVFWGNKLWEGQVWFEAFRSKSYTIALWDLLLMFFATFAKLIIAMRYNKLLKKM